MRLVEVRLDVAVVEEHERYVQHHGDAVWGDDPDRRLVKLSGLTGIDEREDDLGAINAIQPADSFADERIERRVRRLLLIRNVRPAALVPLASQGSGANREANSLFAVDFLPPAFRGSEGPTG